MKIKTIIAFAAVAALIIGCKAPEAVTGGDDSGVPATATDTWLVNSLADIETYASAEPSNRASYTLVKNETEHVQLVISTASNETLTIFRRWAMNLVSTTGEISTVSSGVRPWKLQGSHNFPQCQFRG